MEEQFERGGGGVIEKFQGFSPGPLDPPLTPLVGTLVFLTN